MAKAEKKELSDEEKLAVFNSRLEKFQADIQEDLGFKLGVRLKYFDDAIIPQLAAIPVKTEDDSEKAPSEENKKDPEDSEE